MGRTSDARERLVESASRLFYSRSYEDVGVSEICEAAGVQKGSFYHFFPSKQDLAVAVIDARWREADETFLQPALAPDLPPLERLERLVELHHAYQRRAKDLLGATLGCPFGNMVVELGTTDDVVRERVQAVFADSVARIAATLDDAVAAGDLPPIDTRATAREILAFAEGVFVLAKAENDPEVVRELGSAVRRLAESAVPKGAKAVA